MSLNLIIPIFDCKLKWKKNTFNNEENDLFNKYKISKASYNWDINK